MGSGQIGPEQSGHVNFDRAQLSGAQLSMSQFALNHLGVHIEIFTGHFCGGEYELESGGCRKGLLC